MKARKPTYLSFRLGKETYAVSTKKVLEVLEPQFITPVPNSQEYIEGIIAFRGNIVPVVNIRQRLGIPANGLDGEGAIIIFDVFVNKRNIIVAAVTDKVNEVVPVNDNEILSVPEKGIRFDSTFLTGMIKVNNNFTLIFDIDKVFELNRD